MNLARPRSRLAAISATYRALQGDTDTHDSPPGSVYRTAGRIGGQWRAARPRGVPD